MQQEFTTDRLYLQQLALTDNTFIIDLLNTEGWLRFIGDRQVRTQEAAEAYINKILSNDAVKYWVVRLKEGDVPVGIITFIKRPYLDHHDIGFAFLPAYAGKGLAHEAAAVVLHYLAGTGQHTHILASTVRDNKNSQALLHKLGLCFEKEIQVETELLSLYSVSIDELLINKLIETFFSVFTNKDGKEPKWQQLPELCLPQVSIIKKTGLQQEVYDLDAFTAPRAKLLSDGTLTGFEEKETKARTAIAGHIAQRFSSYKKSGVLNGTAFSQAGTKLFQCVKTIEGWRISAVAWEDNI